MHRRLGLCLRVAEVLVLSLLVSCGSEAETTSSAVGGTDSKPAATSSQNTTTPGTSRNGVPPNSDQSGSSSEVASDLSTSTSVLVPATTSQAESPVSGLALTTGGQLVQLSGYKLARTLVDLPRVLGGVDPDIVAYSESSDVAFVGTCCEPISGSVYKLEDVTSNTPLVSPNPLNGYAPAISPDGSYVAIGQIVGSPISIESIDGGRSIEIPSITSVVGGYAPADTLWIDSRHVASLGLLAADGSSSWVVQVVAIDGIDTPQPVVTMADAVILDPFIGERAPDQVSIRFAGRPDAAHLALHVAGSGDVIVIRSDPSADPAGRVVTVSDTAAKHIWMTGGHVLVTGTDGRLVIDGDVVPGEFEWARS